MIDWEGPWQRFLTLLVLFFVFFWLYKNMKDTKIKRVIQDNIAKLKSER